MTNDDNPEWLRQALSELDDSTVWNFREKEEIGRGNPFPDTLRIFHDAAESDLDEQLATFRLIHPEITDLAGKWPEFLDGRAVGAQATEAINRMIQESSYEDVVYIAAVCTYGERMRVEIGDKSVSPVQATWRIRPASAIGQ
jgi:Rad3-related DNA helicase